jgi:NitT/TauT family transport system substrate-binding protein
MTSEGTERWSRRGFVRGLTLAGTAGLVGFRSGAAEADPPPETTKLRLFEDSPFICFAPHYVAKELLHSEGFNDVQYIKNPPGGSRAVAQVLASGDVDISLSFIPTDLVQIDAGAPVVILAGGHVGCIELAGSSRIRSTRELKGKTVAVSDLRTSDQTADHVFISMFVAHVGLDPEKDINWKVTHGPDNMRLLADGKIDAFMSGPPSLSQEMRAKQIGHVLLNTTTDRPWSQYFCCMVASTTEFVRKHPVATKRALRAIVKAADVCALEPNRVARLIADRGLLSYANALQTLKEIPYGKWREHDPEDAVRFYALRMREVGMIKSTPQKILAQGTDWRFLKELKKELKG